MRSNVSGELVFYGVFSAKVGIGWDQKGKMNQRFAAAAILNILILGK